MKKLEIGAIYKHYKGTKVKVLTEASHSETLEKMVVYIHLEDGCVWVRPKEMFLENLDWNGKTVERFKKIKQEVLVKPSKN